MIECFFFVEKDGEFDGTVRALCVDCKMNKLAKDFPAWFYSGQIGPWTVTCYNCNNIIYLHEGRHEETSTAL